MYTPQWLPAVFSFVLASSVIIVATRSGLLPPCVVPALGFCLHVTELFMVAVLREMQENQRFSEIQIVNRSLWRCL